MKQAWRAAATVAGLALILVLTLAVFGLPLGASLHLMYTGALSDKLALTRTLVKTIPLAITAMGVVVAWRGGMYNIGGEGQFVMGGIAGCVAAKYLLQASPSAPGPVGTAAILSASLIGGGLWGALAGWLKAKRGVEGVISTILLNFVAIQLLAWAVAGPLKEGKGQLPLTDLLPDRMMLPRFDPQTDLHWGIFVALAAVAVVYVFLYFTSAGYRVRLVGQGERAARANRIPANSIKVEAMLISGALCGLAGGVEYVGVAGQLGNSFVQGWGFLAIPVALLGGLHPLLVGLSALYFGALFAGSRNLAGFTTEGTTLIYVIQGAAVLGLVAFRALGERNPLKTEVS